MWEGKRVGEAEERLATGSPNVRKATQVGAMGGTGISSAWTDLCEFSICV